MHYPVLVDLTELNSLSLTSNVEPTQLSFACSKSTIETLQKGVNYIQQ